MAAPLPGLSRQQVDPAAGDAHHDQHPDRLIDEDHARAAPTTLLLRRQWRRARRARYADGRRQYRDEFIRTESGWKFAFREPKNIFIRPDFGGVVVRKSDERQTALADQIMDDDEDILRSLAK